MVGPDVVSVGELPELTPLLVGAPCEGCRDPLVQGESEPTSAFLRRRYCSPGCANRRRGRERSAEAMEAVPERRCAGCNEALVRRGEPGAWTEKLNRFLKRRYCDTACMYGHRESVRRAASPASSSRPRPSPRPASPTPRRKLNSFSISTAPAVPWSPPAPPEPPAVMVPDGDVRRCELHGDVIGVYGCPACNAAERWRARDRVIRPGGEQLW